MTIESYPALLSLSQTAWRRRRAIRTVRALLASVVTKVLDESSGAHYYFNSLTGETSWSRPALFGSEVTKNLRARYRHEQIALYQTSMLRMTGDRWFWSLVNASSTRLLL